MSAPQTMRFGCLKLLEGYSMKRGSAVDATAWGIEKRDDCARVTGKPEVMPTGWQIGTEKRACVDRSGQTSRWSAIRKQSRTYKPVVGQMRSVLGVYLVSVPGIEPGFPD